MDAYFLNTEEKNPVFENMRLRTSVDAGFFLFCFFNVEEKTSVFENIRLRVDEALVASITSIGIKCF